MREGRRGESEWRAREIRRRVTMAFLDNPTIILAHIRQSHVTSDDTGMCEMVLIDHDVDLEKCQSSSLSGGGGLAFGSGQFGDSGSGSEGQSCDLSQSMDITSSWDFGIRRRSNTGKTLQGAMCADACVLLMGAEWDQESSSVVLMGRSNL